MNLRRTLWPSHFMGGVYAAFILIAMGVWTLAYPLFQRVDLTSKEFLPALGLIAVGCITGIVSHIQNEKVVLLLRIMFFCDHARRNSINIHSVKPSDLLELLRSEYDRQVIGLLPEGLARLYRLNPGTDKFRKQLLFVKSQLDFALSNVEFRQK